MLFATELLGANAYDNNGDFVGRVKELFIEPADQPSRVSRVLLSRGRYRPLVARFDQLASAVPGRIKLTTDEGSLELYRPNEAWLAVRKDLLDQQIIDTNGRKVVRINDVDISEQRTNGNVELRVTHVDVGLAGAVRRLLQGVVPSAMIHRFQDQLPPNTIPAPEYVNPVEADRCGASSCACPAKPWAKCIPPISRKSPKICPPPSANPSSTRYLTRKPRTPSPNSTAACKPR